MINKSKFSIIIPVFNSEKIVEQTVRETIIALKSYNLNFELILINDGRTDNSWKVIKNLAYEFNNIKSINLLKNYGQHTAVFCGIQHTIGDYVITMDDDLQNPPLEIIKLIEKINEGYDLVFAKFLEKKHSLFRKFGSAVIKILNEKIFDKPKEITLTNFRIFTKSVADRVSNYKTFYPYIPGLLILFSSAIANVETDHQSRKIGKSNYSLFKILKLVSRLLFNYSSYPLKLLTILGFSISLISFFLGLFYSFRSLLIGSSVPGWTTTVVLLSFFNGFLILMIGVLGEYLTRILNQLSIKHSYQIKETFFQDV